MVKWLAWSFVVAVLCVVPILLFAAGGQVGWVALWLVPLVLQAVGTGGAIEHYRRERIERSGA